MRTSDQVTADLVENLLNSTTSIMRWNCLSREERDEYLIHAQIHGIDEMLQAIESEVKPDTDVDQAIEENLARRIFPG